MRTGIGYDIHRLAEGRPLILGGVTIPSDRGPVAHSDGDVVCHALADALLGSLALGDIGVHFPPSDPQWKGAESLNLLRRVVDLVASKGHGVLSVDVVIVLEHPKVAPYVSRMREALAATLSVSPEAVSLKATTSEGLGPIGRREGVAAWAVATVEPCQSS